MNGHLRVYDVTLTTRSPLHVGSGKSYNKKSFVFDEEKHFVRIMDEEKLLGKLVDGGLVGEYEHYILRRPQAQLGDFLTECGFSQKEMDDVTIYKARVADALVEGTPLAEIAQFMRDWQNRAYVPGSTIKGALRTALLMKLIADNPKNMEPSERNRTKDDVESAYLNTLSLNKKRPRDEVNSVMRGISVADSESIDPDDMILARKDDVAVSGVRKSINTIREAVRPGVPIRCKLTLDTSVKSGIDEAFIRDAVARYGAYYKEMYYTRFKLPEDAKIESFDDCLVLGGGSGYFGKNIAYPLLGYGRGLKFVTGLMSRKFRKHYHQNDEGRGISPHILKHTGYQGRSYHFGVCQFAMVPVS